MNSLERLQAAADDYDTVVKINGTGSQEINRLLFTTERLLTREKGLEGRPWYKHHIYAPGFYTGYGVKTIPGVRESIEQREYEKVEPQIRLAAEVLDGLSERIELLVSRLNS
jgi:N-acetylated-alpha-linked acidic dipeptidase